MIKIKQIIEYFYPCNHVWKLKNNNKYHKTLICKLCGKVKTLKV